MNTKNKVAIYLIIAGAVLLLLTAATLFTLKKGLIKGFELGSAELSFLSLGMPESTFEEDVDISLTEATVYIDDTVFDEVIEEDAEITEETRASATKTTGKNKASTATAATTAKATATVTAKATKQQTATKTQASIPTSPQVITGNRTTNNNYATNQAAATSPATATNQTATSANSSSPLYTSNEFTIGGIKITVQFWNPEKPFKGFHLKMSEKLLLLFGIDQFSPLRFTKSDDGKLIMYYNNTPYLLKENRDIEVLQKYSE